jgi:hypothetical protein
MTSLAYNANHLADALYPLMSLAVRLAPPRSARVTKEKVRVASAIKDIAKAVAIGRYPVE